MNHNNKMSDFSNLLCKAIHHYHNIFRRKKISGCFKKNICQFRNIVNAVFTNKIYTGGMKEKM